MAARNSGAGGATRSRSAASSRPAATRAGSAAAARESAAAPAPEAARDPAATDQTLDTSKVNDGGPGPASSLETGKGSLTGASAGGDTDHEGRRSGPYEDSGAMDYDVQVHSDEKVGKLDRGLNVVRVNAKSGDEAALKVREQNKENYGLSIRGVTPASDPDPNSLGGERDASIMIANAENGGDAGINPLGTEANAEAVEELGKADIEDLGE